MKTLPGEPQPDSDRHLPLEILEQGLRRLAAPPADIGQVREIVRRLGDGSRDTPQRAQLTVADGLVGDDWSRRPPRDPDAQVTVMRHDVAVLIANGQSLTLFGDNLLVDFDLSAANLPAGTRLKVGEAVVTVTALPHTGCAKFQARFGPDALRLTALADLRATHLRGVHWRVVESGAVAVGDEIKILSRGAD